MVFVCFQSEFAVPRLRAVPRARQDKLSTGGFSSASSELSRKVNGGNKNSQIGIRTLTNTALSLWPPSRRHWETPSCPVSLKVEIIYSIKESCGRTNTKRRLTSTRLRLRNQRRSLAGDTWESDRIDPNYYYTTERAVRDKLVAKWRTDTVTPTDKTFLIWEGLVTGWEILLLK